MLYPVRLFASYIPRANISKFFASINCGGNSVLPVLPNEKLFSRSVTSTILQRNPKALTLIQYYLYFPTILHNTLTIRPEERFQHWIKFEEKKWRRKRRSQNLKFHLREGFYLGHRGKEFAWKMWSGGRENPTLLNVNAQFYDWIMVNL